MIPLSKENFVPRGCVLRLTQSVSALVVYTGSETKMIQNATKPRFKYTEIDRFLSRLVIVLVGVLFTLACLFDIGSYFWYRNNIQQMHLNLKKQANVYYVYNTLSWFLVINTMRPLCV